MGKGELVADFSLEMEAGNGRGKSTQESLLFEPLQLDLRPSSSCPDLGTSADSYALCAWLGAALRILAGDQRAAERVV